MHKDMNNEYSITSYYGNRLLYPWGTISCSVHVTNSDSPIKNNLKK